VTKVQTFKEAMILIKMLGGAFISFLAASAYLGMVYVVRRKI